MMGQALIQLPSKEKATEYAINAAAKLTDQALAQLKTIEDPAIRAIALKSILISIDPALEKQATEMLEAAQKRGADLTVSMRTVLSSLLTTYLLARGGLGASFDYAGAITGGVSALDSLFSAGLNAYAQVKSVNAAQQMAQAQMQQMTVETAARQQQMQMEAQMARQQMQMQQEAQRQQAALAQQQLKMQQDAQQAQIRAQQQAQQQQAAAQQQAIVQQAAQQQAAQRAAQQQAAQQQAAARAAAQQQVFIPPQAMTTTEKKVKPWMIIAGAGGVSLLLLIVAVAAKKKKK